MKSYLVKEREYYKCTGFDDMTLVGSPTVNNYVMSGFDASNYAKLDNSLLTALSTANTFELFFKFTTGSDVSTRQAVFRQGVSRSALGYNSIGLEIRGDIVGYPSLGWMYSYAKGQQTVAGTTQVYPNTTYWAKMNFTGSFVYIYISTDGENWIYDSGLQTTTKLSSSSYDATFGCSVENNSTPSGFFLGSIDFKECYIKIDGNLWWQGCNTIEGTSSDYNFYKDIDNYKGVKEYDSDNDVYTYKAFRGYEKGEWV